MKILLDECIPRKLKYSLPDHECQTVPEPCLAGKKNGAWPGLAESASFEIFATMDKGLEYERNLAGRSIAIPILRARSNRLADLLPLAPGLRRTMKLARKGEINRISGGEPAS
jgi:hypothetical protein